MTTEEYENLTFPVQVEYQSNSIPYIILSTAKKLGGLQGTVITSKPNQNYPKGYNESHWGYRSGIILN